MPSDSAASSLSALVCASNAPEAPDLVADLRGVGVHVFGAVALADLVREALRCDPGVVVIYEPHPDERLMRALSDLREQAGVAVAVFTSDPDADRIDEATRAGAHAYVVNGYGVQRLRSVIHVACARCRHERERSGELAALSHRFEERKLVDRAKGILMRARQMSEDEAYRTLRTVAMHANQRLGQVSQQVIAAARYAEGVNHAGQLRMLSQRAVKLYALGATGTREGLWRERLASTALRIGGNIESLSRSLSQATFGDLVVAVTEPWRALEPALAGRAQRSRLAEIDALAEQLLARADTLTQALESAGLAPTLHAINVAGRQRMLSQRFAKQTLLAAPGDETAEQFERALVQLRELPLTDNGIRAALDAAARQWASLKDCAARVSEAAGREDLAEASEALLETFEQLTRRYEISMQTLMGVPLAK